MPTNTAATSARHFYTQQTHYAQLDITFADTTAKAIVTVPKNSTIVRVLAHITAAFNDSGTDLIKVQRSGQTAGELASIDGSTAGVVVGTALATALSAVARPAADTDITVQYVGQNSNAAAGAARVIVEFIPPDA